MVYEGAPVVDAVSHAYNHRADNYKNDVAAEFDTLTFEFSRGWSPEGYRIPEEKYFVDQRAADVEGVLFRESDVDFTIFHSNALTDYFEDGYITVEKGAELRERNPDRVAVYGSVNPLADDAMEQMEYQAEELDVSGFKIYPARFQDGRTLSLALNEPKTGMRVIRKARELGVKNIAVHKGIPIGRGHTRYYKVDDVDEVAPLFPDMNFEIVHAGMAFMEHTSLILARYPNVYANLEAVANLMFAQPRRFGEVLGQLLFWGGPDKILFASGATFAHPQPLIEAFWDYEIPDDLVEGYGYPQVTDEIKRKILGLNALDLLGIDPDDVPMNTKDDVEPWSSVRSNSGGDGDGG